MDLEQILKSISQKARIITHILCRGVDLVGDTGSQLADGFQLLCLEKLILQALAFSDVSTQTD